jgi:hypothetical protein
MFGSSKPVVLDRYGHRRSRLRVPRWLVLLLLGITAGAGGLLYLQENHLPKRLSAQASTELRDAFEQADAERTKLKADLADVTKRLDVALTEAKTATTELAASRQTVERLRAGLDFVAAALPPDPRGGSVAVRGGDVSVRGGKLEWELVLSRAAAPGSAPLAGVLQLAVSGQTARDVEGRVALAPVPLKLGAHEVLRGSAALPEGFRPRQTTIQVLDRPGGSQLGMRVLLVD